MISRSSCTISIKTDTGEIVIMNTKSVFDLFAPMIVRFLMEAAWMAGCPITWSQAFDYVVG